MVKFCNNTISVEIPECKHTVEIPNYMLVYGEALSVFPEEKKIQIKKKLFLSHTFKDVPRDVFLSLGLLERFFILQRDPDAQISSYDKKFNQRAMRLMDIFGCITSSCMEDEELYRSFLCGVVDFYRMYDSIFS